MYRHVLSAAAAILAALTIAACSPSAPTANTTPAAPTAATAATAESSQPTVPAATSAPTAAPAEPTAPQATAAATAAPQATAETSAGVLPAPLYVSDKGQIVRIERDGTTRTQITNEPSEGDALAVTEFALSPLDGTLMYVVQQGAERVLVRADADGKNRAELFKEAGASISSPVWSPDGRQIALSIVRDNGDGTRGESGVYVLPAQGGTPTLVQADDSGSFQDSDSMLFGHQPVSWSPDGGKLMLSRYAMATEYCEPAILVIGQKELVKPVSPSETVRASCGPTAWSTDGQSLYLTFMPMDNAYMQGAGLWRADAATGEVTPVVPETLDGKVPIVRGPAEVVPGTISGFVALNATLPPMFAEPDQQPSYQLAKIDAASGAITVLRQELYNNFGQVLWAPDASGAVVQAPTEQGYFGLTWLPANDGPAVALSQSMDVYGFDWGK